MTCWKFNRQFLVSILVTSALVGCKTVGPDYQRPQNGLPVDFTESVSNQPQSMQSISQAWWKQYQDPTLNDLIDQALRNNTDIKLAVANIEAADAFAREVGAATLPSVDLTTNATRSRVTGTGPFPVFGPNPRNNFQYQFGTNFEIDFWGKLARAKESARAQMLASRYAKDTATLSLTGLVTQYYLSLRTFEAQLGVMHDSLHSREESLTLTQHRLEGGVASALDVHQAEVAAATLRAQIADFEGQRAIALHQLATLTGQLNLNLDKGEFAALPIPPMPPVGLPSSLLENRPDIRQTEANLIAQNANIGNAKASLYPSISLTAGLGGESLALGDLLKSASRVWTGGLNVSLPIFNSGRLNAKVDQATAKQKLALVQYEASIQSAFQEVNDALVNLRQNTEREMALNEGVTSAKEALKISENRYQMGYSTYLEVLDAQRVYNDIALNAIASRQARLNASVALFKALGGGWQDELANQKLDEIHSAKE
jgi:outer membrane protein, multidrug efflux system